MAVDAIGEAVAWLVVMVVESVLYILKPTIDAEKMIMSSSIRSIDDTIINAVRCFAQ